MQKNMKNNKRMSLDPSKNAQPSHAYHKHYNATELQVKQNIQHEESQSSFSNHGYQQYPPDQLPNIFKTISKGKDVISYQQLYSLLREEGYGENLYTAVQMISLVDRNRKGFITLQQFTQFFTDKNQIDKQQFPPLSQEMQNKRKWVDAIDKNLDQLEYYQQKQYCEYVASKLKEEKKVIRKD